MKCRVINTLLLVKIQFLSETLLDKTLMILVSYLTTYISTMFNIKAFLHGEVKSC